MQIMLTPEVEQAVIEQARKKGKTPEEFVAEVVQQRFIPTAEVSDERVALLKSIGSPAGVSLSDEAVSSDALYD